MFIIVFVFKGRSRTKQDANEKSISADEEVPKSPWLEDRAWGGVVIYVVSLTFEGLFD